jgi:ABC-type Fe3+/spermidine/putrescine transport system ATPase subunit
MSDRIAVLNRGRIEQIGTPEELYDRPATRFVASFIGDTNFVAGRVVGVSAGVCEIETAGGRVRASRRQSVDTGASVTVAVRPERIVLGPLREGALAGTVTDVIFLGTARKYVVRLADRSECTVLRQVGDAAFDTSDTAVALSWHSDHAAAFPAEEVSS